MERQEKGQILDILYLESRCVRDSGARDGLMSSAWELGACSSCLLGWEGLSGVTLEAQCGGSLKQPVDDQVEMSERLIILS